MKLKVIPIDPKMQALGKLIDERLNLKQQWISEHPNYSMEQFVREFSNGRN